MMTYRVQRMDNENYIEYAKGGYNYTAETVYIEANDAEEALLKATGLGYHVNPHSIKTLTEIREEEKAKKMANLKAVIEEEEATRKKKAKEEEKAKKAGMTLEEYKKAKNRKANIARVRRELEKAKKEVARLEATLKRLEEI